VRGMIRRSLRLEVVAGLGIALAMSAFAPTVWASSVSTETTLNVTTHDNGGRTKATVKVAVAGADGSAASGAISIVDGSKTLASASLDGEGQATTEVSLIGGAHNLRAVYNGDSTHIASASTAQLVQAQAATTAGFTLSLTPVTPSSFPMTLTAGTAGTVKVTVTPVNNTSLSAPMFVSLSCSGLPDQTACTFSPSTIEILSTTPTSCTSGSAAADCPPTSTMVLQTQAGGTAKNALPTGKNSNTIAWAVLLPGMMGLGGLAWSTRRRRWMSRLSLMALLALVTMLGATGCNPRYGYYHHAPDTNLPTPSGSYTITITGQSSDGITAITNSTTMALVVK
jgi:hypothetical protein